MAFLIAAIVPGWYHLSVVQFPLGLVGVLLMLAAERRKRRVKQRRTTEEEWKATFPPPVDPGLLPAMRGRVRP